MNIIGGQLGGISQQLRGLQAQAGAVGQNMTRALGFHELERFGRAGMDAFGGMINRAADLQMAMTKVRIATSSTESGMKSLGEIIIDTSSKHAMSASQAADMMAVVARTGMGTDTIKSTFGSISKFADIEKFERHMEFEQSAKIAATTARFFGARSPEQTERVLNNLYKAMNASPMAPNQLLTSLQTFAPIGRKLGMSQEETFQAASLMGTMGLGSKGGTGLFNILLKSIGTMPNSLTAHRSAGQAKAFKDLGLDQEGAAYKDGKFNFTGFFAKLTEQSGKMDSKRFVGDLIGALTDRGGRVAAALSTPEAQANLKEMLQSWGKITTMQDAYEQEQKNLNYQSGVLETNLQNLSATAGTLAMESMVPMKAKLADMVAGIDKFLKASPVIGGDVGKIVQIGNVLSTVAAGIGKFGQVATSMNALQGLFAGTGARVWVTNMPGGGLGGLGGPGPGGPSNLLASAVKVVGAGAVGYAVGTVIDQTVTALHGKSIGESYADIAKKLGYGSKEEKSRQEHNYLALMVKIKERAAEKRRAQKTVDEFKANGVNLNGATIHVHGVQTTSDLYKELNRAANRTSGSSTKSSGHSKSSGYGGGGGG